MQDIELAYGKTGLQLTLPDNAQATVIRKRPLPVPDDAHAVIEQALACPIEAQPLEHAAGGAASACILICDITRPVPNHLFLRPLIERLVAAGLPAPAITVLVATGLHRPNIGDELRELVGDEWVLENVTVANHDARDDAA
ncbi:MAG: lactate racemase domain-containing protein, partial [Gammaproteobacteria bacterium]|nr:lactate racemase domain-containing protein [Gammaproteobacteria bacterium]